jgi:hypothetical protein
MFNHKNPPKIKIRIIIIAILIVIILVAIVLNFTIKKDNTANQTTPPENSNPSSQTNQEINQNPRQTQPPSPQTQTPPPTPPVQPTPPAPQREPIYPTISTSELQSIMQNFPQIMNIKDPKIKMQFHDNNSLYLGYTYFIGSGGQVSQFSGQASDMWLTINVYNALALRDSSDKCSYLKSVIQSGKAWVIEQSSNPFVIMKYMSIKSCVM